MKRLIAVLLATLTVLAFSACSGSEEKMSVYVLTGPTGIGAVNMWEAEEYDFHAVQSPDEAVAKISAGEADIAAVSTNLAAKLYQKTGGQIKILAVNTLGVLSVLEKGEEISSLSDLSGKKIVTTGQGANPQYIIEYLLAKNGVSDTQIEYKADGAELVTVWNSDENAVIIAPSPVSTSILMKYEGSRKALDLTEEWEKCSGDSALMMGCLIATADFCEKNPDKVDAFIEAYAKSAEKANADAENTGALCEKYGIVPKAAVAQKAIPDCHICCITGDGMKNGLNGYLQVLFDADAQSIGEMPDDGIWYK